MQCYGKDFQNKEKMYARETVLSSLWTLTKVFPSKKKTEKRGISEVGHACHILGKFQSSEKQEIQ